MDKPTPDEAAARGRPYAAAAAVRLAKELDTTMVTSDNQAQIYIDQMSSAVLAQHEQIERLRAALDKALDALEDVWEGEGRCPMPRERIAALREEFDL